MEIITQVIMSDKEVMNIYLPYKETRQLIDEAATNNKKFIHIQDAKNSANMIHIDHIIRIKELRIR